MSNYTIPPRLRASDYAKGKITQDEIISLQIANDANISKARKDAKLQLLGVAPAVPIDRPSPDDLLADDAAQEATARSNIEKLGFRPQEAAAIITGIRNDAVLDFTQLNTNFPAIESDIKARFNPKLLTPAFFIEYFRKYSDELAGSAGMRVFNPNNGGLNGLVNTVEELRRIIPSARTIEYILRAAERQNLVSEDIVDALGYLIRLLPDDGSLQRLSGLDPVRQQRIIEDLLQQFQNLPSAGEMDRIAMMIDRDQFDRRAFYNAIKSLIDSIPQGRQVNIVQEEVGGASSVPSGMSLKEESVAEAQSRLRLLRDTKAAQSALDNNLDPRGLTPAQQSIYANLAGVVRKAPSISDITDFTGTTTESLGSAMSLDTASLAQIKATIKLNPDIVSNLKELSTGKAVNYNDLTKTKTKNPRKVWWEDTNLRELFQTKFGKGIKMSSKIKVGKGLAVKETPSYKEYGKYAIHLPQLEQQDILNVKYKSLGQIPKFKPIPVSDIFRDFIIDLLDNGKPNARVYTQISPDERKFFEEMSVGAGVWNTLGLKRTTTSTDEEENSRFQLLKGEYLAGNNNPKIIGELRRLTVKMMNDGRIRKSQGVDLLMELS
jgi:hypothetical protein